jgi:hypothetical protein
LCLVSGYVFAVLALGNVWFLLPSAACFGLFTAGALIYNELARKNKSVSETLRSAPVMAAYYHVRAFGYVRQYLRLWLGLDRLPRVKLSGA